VDQRGSDQLPAGAAGCRRGRGRYTAWAGWQCSHHSDDRPAIRDQLSRDRHRGQTGGSWSRC